MLFVNPQKKKSHLPILTALGWCCPMATTRISSFEGGKIYS